MRHLTLPVTPSILMGGLEISKVTLMRRVLSGDDTLAGLPEMILRVEGNTPEEAEPQSVNMIFFGAMDILEARGVIPAILNDFYRVKEQRFYRHSRYQVHDFIMPEKVAQHLHMMSAHAWLSLQSSFHTIAA